MYNNEELYHYGVKGMKWGVRRNTRVLANHRRNVKVRKIKNDYEVGKISKEKKKKLILEANLSKKKYIQDTNERLKNISSETEMRKYKAEVTRQTINEVPHQRLKKGITTANKVLGGMHVANSIATGVVGAVGAMSVPVAGPALAGVYIGSGVAAAAVETGIHALAQMGIDKLS